MTGGSEKGEKGRAEQEAAALGHFAAKREREERSHQLRKGFCVSKLEHDDTKHLSSAHCVPVSVPSSRP